MQDAEAMTLAYLTEIASTGDPQKFLRVGRVKVGGRATQNHSHIAEIGYVQLLRDYDTGLSGVDDAGLLMAEHKDNTLQLLLWGISYGLVHFTPDGTLNQMPDESLPRRIYKKASELYLSHLEVQRRETCYQIAGLFIAHVNSLSDEFGIRGVTRVPQPVILYSVQSGMFSNPPEMESFHRYILPIDQ